MKTPAYAAFVLFAAGSLLFGQAVTLDDEGETLRYTISYGHINAGGATLMKKPYNGQLLLSGKVITNKVFSALYPVRDALSSLCSSDDFATEKFNVDFHEGYFYSRKESFYFDQGIGMISGTTLFFPKGTTDPLSALYFLRSLDLRPDTSLSHAISDGRKVYYVIAKVLKKERVRTIFGMTDTLVIEPQISKIEFEGVMKKKGRVHIWFTDDADHIPVMAKGKLVIGSLVAKLKSIER